MEHEETSIRWADLSPEPAIVEALVHAGPQPTNGDQNQKRGWSERFANACAVAIAREIAQIPELRGKKTIRPTDLEEGVAFANAMLKLRQRTGRIDPSLAHHSSRCDIAFVALYTTGDEPEGLPPGLVRFIDFSEAPPRRGRPRVETTRSLCEAVIEVVSQAMAQVDVDWADPEPDADQP